MTNYQFEDITVRYPEQLTEMSFSSLISNQASFHIQLPPDANGELFFFESSKYRTSCIIHDGIVEFRRNDYLAQKKVNSSCRYYQVLLSWNPERFQLALMFDGDVGGEDACKTIETKRIIIPPSLLQQIRKYNIIHRTTYDSTIDFLNILSEGIVHVNKNIQAANSHRSFWDIQKGQSPIPKKEPQSMAGIAALLQDHSLISGYELVQESSAGAGRLDLRAIAPKKSGGFINICIEAKNAHSNDLKHGLTDQLPEYMERVGSDYGIYLVLWYKCKYFQKPVNDLFAWELTKLKPLQNINIVKFDLSLPLNPSDRKFKYK